MKRTLYLLTCLVLLSSSAAFSQDDDRWSIGVHLNSLVWSDDDTDVDWGLTARYRALSFLSVEGRINFEDDDQIFSPDESFEMSALFYPYRTGIIDFYASVGASYLTSSFEDDLFLKFGVGFDIPIGPNFSFFTDFRLFTIAENEIFIDQFRSIKYADDVRATMGFSFRF